MATSSHMIRQATLVRGGRYLGNSALCEFDKARDGSAFPKGKAKAPGRGRVPERPRTRERNCNRLTLTSNAKGRNLGWRVGSLFSSRHLNNQWKAISESTCTRFRNRHPKPPKPQAHETPNAQTPPAKQKSRFHAMTVRLEAQHAEGPVR